MKRRGLTAPSALPCAAPFRAMSERLTTVTQKPAWDEEGRRCAASMALPKRARKE